jgi:hypothetical protein
MNTVRLYHGSLRTFDRFSKDVWPRFDNAQQHVGYFFTNNPEYALKYANHPDGKLYVVDCDLGKIKHEPMSDPWSLATVIERNYTNEEAIEYADGLIAEGYNSICFEIPGDDGASEVAIFYPDQAHIVEVISAHDAELRIRRGLLQSTDIAVDYQSLKLI